MSEYGERFDEWAQVWAKQENDHDKMHPDRSECGGVGGCPMMASAVDIEHKLIDLLELWRRRKAAPTEVLFGADAHGGADNGCGARELDGCEWPHQKCKGHAK